MSDPLLTVGCDPDTTAPAYAFFRGTELHSVTYERGGPRAAPLYPRTATLVIETQFIRPGRSVSSDILDLAWAAGECSMHFDHVIKVSPARWKGNVDKSTQQEWTQLALRDAEKYILRGLPKYQLRELLDAVGIGLWYLRRLK